jgi:hypothetical protein
MMIVFLAVPLAILAAMLVGAWLEARRSPWAFGMGRIISNSFSAIGGAPLAFIGISFLLNGLPGQVMMMAVGSPIVPVDRIAANATGLIAGWGLLWIFLWPFAQLLMIGLALDTLTGRPVDLRGAVVRALRRAPAGIVVTFLTYLAVLVGVLFLVVPGIFLMLTWFVVLPVLVAEDRGMFENFGRSTELLRGMRWRLLLLLVMVFVLWSLVGGMAGGMALAFGGAGSWGFIAAQTISSTLLGTLPPAGAAAIYHEARTVKEGMGGHDLAAVFA